MNRVFEWLSRYNRREQTLLLTGALAIVLYILWMGLLAPLKEKRELQISSNLGAAESLERVKLMAAQIKQAQQTTASGNTSNTNISQLIDSSLQSNGLRMSGFQPGSRGEVRVRLDNVSYAAMMQWLHDLEYRHDVAVKDLSIAATNTAGEVTANIRLSKN